MDISLPSRDALKAQAKRLRASLASGHNMTHAQALEAVAHQWGFRDWNTLSAKVNDGPCPVWAPGQRITGRYLGHRFAGRIKAAIRKTSGYWSLTLRFDAPIDVVASHRFSAFRQQINCTVNRSGSSVCKTSDGMPHVALDNHWDAPV